MSNELDVTKNLNVLFVDDDQSILDGVKRNLHKFYKVSTACGGEEGLKVIQEHGPFAVVVSDMRMPVMDGARFLAQVKDIAPDSVRIMLTGYTDIDSAMAAVNKGNIFRFMTKPVKTEALVHVLQDAIQQYHLIIAERELLEKTLKGSIQVLIDILSLTNPTAFSRASRVEDFVSQVITHLDLADSWQYEVAAMLSQLGCVTVPEEILEKYYAGEELADEEKEMVTNLPDIASKLIGGIPRLENVSKIIVQSTLAVGDVPGELGIDVIVTGAHILRAVMDFDIDFSRGVPVPKILGTMADKYWQYDKRIMEALRHVNVPELESAERMVAVEDLRPGMILAEEMRAANGMLVAAKGQAINDTIRQRLKNFATRGDVQKNVRVLFSKSSHLVT